MELKKKIKSLEMKLRFRRGVLYVYIKYNWHSYLMFCFVFVTQVSSLRSSMESAHNRISELEASKSSIQPSKAQQGLYARNDEKLVLSGNIAKPNAPALPVSTTPAYGMGGLSGAGMGLAAIGVGVAGFGVATMPQLAPPSEADTFVMKDPDLGEGPNSPASNR